MFSSFPLPPSLSSLLNPENKGPERGDIAITPSSNNEQERKIKRAGDVFLNLSLPLALFPAFGTENKDEREIERNRKMQFKNDGKKKPKKNKGKEIPKKSPLSDKNLSLLSLYLSLSCRVFIFPKIGFQSKLQSLIIIRSDPHPPLFFFFSPCFRTYRQRRSQSRRSVTEGDPTAEGVRCEMTKMGLWFKLEIEGGFIR